MTEALADILQYTGVPVSDHLLLPLGKQISCHQGPDRTSATVALGYAEDCSERVAVTLGNLASTVRVAMCNVPARA